MKRRIHFALLSMFAVSLTACAVLESRLDSDDPGIVYYLPKTMLRIELSGLSTNEPKFDVKTFNVPDPRHRYTLYYRRNPFFHDRVCVSLDATNPSLLSTVEFSTQDATPEIAIALSELLAKSGSVDTRFAHIGLAPAELAAPQFPKDVVLLTIDLSEPNAIHEANARIARESPGLQIEIPGIEYFGGDDGTACEETGLCFRTAIRAPVHLFYKGRQVASGKTTTNSVDTFDFTIINHRHMGRMDLERAFMVEKVLRLGFKDGIMTHLIMRKPSEVLATVKLPLAVLDTFLAVPANFINVITGPSPDVKKQADALDALNKKLDEIAKRVQGQALGDAGYNTVFKLQCKGTLIAG